MSNDATLDKYFTLFNDPASTTYHDVNYLMSHIFCPDEQHKIPSVGITDYGPQFIGASQVTELFRQLFKTFPDVAVTPVLGAPRLYSPANYSPKTIGVQTTLTGTQNAIWFPPNHQFYSPPLSDISPDKLHVMKIPACAVFTFNDDNLVCHMAIYFDRYRLMRQLTPSATAAPPPVTSAVQGKRVTVTIDNE